MPEQKTVFFAIPIIQLFGMHEFVAATGTSCTSKRKGRVLNCPMPMPLVMPCVSCVLFASHPPEASVSSGVFALRCLLRLLQLNEARQLRLGTVLGMFKDWDSCGFSGIFGIFIEGKVVANTGTLCVSDNHSFCLQMLAQDCLFVMIFHPNG